MKAVALTAALLIAGGAHAQESLAQLAWLAGCWKQTGEEAGSVEQWMPIAGDSMIGMARTVRGGKTVAWEFMRIARGDDGRYAFFAQPSGKTPDTFRLTQLDAQEAVFENPDHPFPQKVVYRLDAPGRLEAHIEGITPRKERRRVDFPMVKVACD